MALDWEVLFTKQKKLDQYINETKQLQDRQLFADKFLALLVELGELANETRCFKFWSTKKASDKQVVLEEYVDNIHFLLSLGLEKNFRFSTIDTPISNLSTTEQFNDVFQKGLDFYKAQTETAYITLFQAYLQLAANLGFADTDIIEAYEMKNEVNYARQDQGY